MSARPERTPELTKQFFEFAIDMFKPWRLGNQVLYGLCEEHPNHTTEDDIIAKFWLIGRAYAANRKSIA
jgi:hypothetical protein